MFGPYRIEKLLGRGGMGEVYRAYDESQKRTVALKVLSPHLAADETFRSRFRRESELAARLREAHVIPIHRYGEIEGRLFIDMRLVEGSDLASVLEEQTALPPGRAVGIIDQVARALDAAHADGLIHRDVKPSNILVCDRDVNSNDDFVYLVDFGIARPVEDDGPGLTKTGSALGSFEYMAPERFLEGAVDRRTDVYSLGCLLYECLTGRRPFSGEGLPALMYGHLNTPPPLPSQAVASLPPELDEVIARAMAKEPERRFARAGDLAWAAQQALSSVPGAGTTPINEVSVRGGPTKVFTANRAGAIAEPTPTGTNGAPPPTGRDAGSDAPVSHPRNTHSLGSYIPAYGPPVARPGYGPPQQTPYRAPPGKYPPQSQVPGRGASWDMTAITIADWLVAGGGLLFFVFSFLPWVSVSSDLCDGVVAEVAAELDCGSGSVSAWMYSGLLGVASVLLLLAAVAIVAALGALPKRFPTSYITAGLGLLGLIFFLIGFVDILTADDFLDFSVGPTFGTWFGLLAILVIVAGLVMSFKQPMESRR